MDKQLVPVALKGVNQKAPEGLRVAGTLDRAQNCYPYKGSTESGFQFKKCTAWTELGDLGVGAVGRRLGTRQNELLALAEGGPLWSWDAQGAVTRLRGYADPLTTESLPVYTGTTSLDTAQVCYASGYVVYAWEDSSAGFVYYSVQDYTTGQWVLTGSLMATSSSWPRLVAAGSYVLLFWVNGANLKVARMSTAAPNVGFGSTTTLKTDVHGTPWYDIQANAADNVVVAYKVTATANVVVFNTSSALGVAGTQNLAVAYDQAGSWLERTAFTDGSLYLVVSSSASGVKVLKISSAALTLTTTIAMDATTAVGGVCGFVEETNQSLNVLFDASSTSTGAAVVKYVQSNNGAAGTGTATSIRGVYLASKPFKTGTTSGVLDWRVLFTYNSPSTATFEQDHYLIGYAFWLSGVRSVFAPSLCGRHLEDAGGGVLTRRAHVPAVSTLSSTMWLAPTLKKVTLSASGSTFVSQTGINALRITRGSALLGPPVEAGNSTYFPGSLPIVYDGRVSRCAGFLVSPEGVSGYVVGVGGSLTSSATYQYCLVYEGIDVNGDLWRSPISDIVSITTSSTQNRIQVDIPYYTLDLTADQSYGVSIGVYRTEGNGSKFYKIRTLSNPIGNSVTGTTVTITDDLADTTLTSYQPLYTDSGELEDFPPPPCRGFFLWNDRLWAYGCEDGTLWPSKTIRQGYGCAWNPGLAVQLPETVSIVGGIGMEDRAIVWSTTAMFIITGDGPDDTGASGEFKVTKVPHELGATGPNAIARTPDGAIFMTPSQGLWLQSRGLESAYVGAPIEDTATGQTVTGAVVRDDLPQVWFLTSGGTVLIYDWVFKTWCTRTNVAAVAACKWRGELYHLSSGGKIRRHPSSGGTYTDGDGTVIQSALEFSFLSFAGIEGFQRLDAVVVYGVATASGAMQSDAYIDYDGVTVVESWTHTPALQAKDFSLEPRNRRCSSWKLKIQSTGADAGFEVAALACWVGVKKGRNRLPAGKRPAQT